MTRCEARTQEIPFTTGSTRTSVGPVVGTSSFRCDLPEGHDGDHAASIGFNGFLTSWPKEEQKVRA